MDKLYWVVCEEKGATLFEGRFQGRTRGGAIKFLKDQIGRPGLNGTVFTITEIPVPLIREIVEAIMKGEPVPTGTTAAVLTNGAAVEAKPERFDAFKKTEEPTASLAPLTDWKAVSGRDYCGWAASRHGALPADRCAVATHRRCR